MAGRVLRRAHAGAVEVELALGRRPLLGQLGLGVAPQDLLEQVARLRGVEQVGGDRGVERQAPHVDIHQRQRPHDGLGLVGGDRAAALGGKRHQRGERGPHGLVVEQRGGDPRHVGRLGVGDDRQAVERRAALAAGPRRGQRHGHRPAAGPGRGVGRPGAERVEHLRRGLRRLDDRDLGLDHVGDRGGEARALGAQGLGQALAEGVELQEVEEAGQLVGVVRLAHQVVDRRRHRRVADQHHHLGVEPDLALVLGQVGAQLGGLLVDVLVEPLDAVVLGDEPGGRLLPHPRHARQVVGGVAPQRRVGHVEPRRHAGALGDAGLVVEHVVAHAPPVVEDLDVRVLHQLVRVAVAGDDDDVDRRVAGLGGEGGDDVVGLEARQLDDRDAERLDHLADQAHLLAQDVGRRVAVGLVGVDPLVAEGGFGPVERHRHPARAVVAHEVDEHRREPEHRVRDLPGGRRHVGRQREEGAVGERVPVDQQ